MKKLFFSLFSVIIFFLIYLISNNINEYNFWNRTSSLILLVFSIIHIFISIIKIFESKLIPKYKDYFIMIISIFFFLFLLELVFFFIPRSHFFGNTLASKNWHTFFKAPINSFGYHDSE